MSVVGSEIFVHIAILIKCSIKMAHKNNIKIADRKGTNTLF